jgi:hypothetical protein
MKLRHVVSCGLVLAALALTGCDEGRQRPGQTSVRVVNVAPGFAQLQFRREQVNPATMDFKTVQDYSWDLDTYDFYVLERSVDFGTQGREWTFARTLQPDVGSYMFVLAETGGEISPVVVENPQSSTTVAQVAAVHAAAELPALDLYLVAPGVGIAGATPHGTFAALGQIPTQGLPTGDYEVWVTTAGNPADVLFASDTVTLSAGLVTIIVTPEGGASTADFSVVVLQGFATVLYDRNTPAELRVVNGATDTAPRDFAINREFSPPLFSAMPFATPTPYATVPVASDTPINVTPVGNPGVLELDQLFGSFRGQHSTLLFTGDAGTLFHTVANDDNRRIHGEAKLRFFNAASQFLAVEFVLTTPDADPNLQFAVATLLAPGISDYTPLSPGDYDLYLRNAATFAALAGPTRISVAAGGLYSVMAVNGPDTATAGIVLLDDFQ